MRGRSYRHPRNGTYLPRLKKVIMGHKCRLEWMAKIHNHFVRASNCVELLNRLNDRLQIAFFSQTTKYFFFICLKVALTKQIRHSKPIIQSRNEIKVLTVTGTVHKKAIKPM